jgi:hypothetical protein
LDIASKRRLSHVETPWIAKNFRAGVVCIFLVYFGGCCSVLICTAVGLFLLKWLFCDRGANLALLYPTTMRLLTRQVSPDSIYSNWSDSSPPGPTINLHALAKPLMRLMYHWQALKFMKKTRDIPISTKSAEICLSYLEYDVSPPHLPRLTALQIQIRGGVNEEQDSRVSCREGPIRK